MRIGVDFDNTLVCFDHLFHRAAVKRGMIPESVAAQKEAVRNYLRQAHREEEWTELQGYVYGTMIREAPAFPGVEKFFLRCRDRGVPVYIISHKTRTPFLGAAYDLHRAAQEWLERRGFYSRLGLSPDHVFWEQTKEGKLKRIAEMECTHFVDDLPEFLAEPRFPSGVVRILFSPNEDPARAVEEQPGIFRARSWEEIERRLLNEK